MRRRWILCLLTCMCLCVPLTGCGAEHYTEDIKDRYERTAVSAAEEYLDERGMSAGATYELLAPDGVTMLVSGMFFWDGLPVQYIFNADTETLYASMTESGFTHSRARECVADEIADYLAGRDVVLSSVRSLSWRLPYTEYRYTVRTEDGKKVTGSSSPTEVSRWLLRPYLPWDISIADAEAFVSGLLNGSPSQVSDLCIELRCRSFDGDGARRERSGTGLMQVFSGLTSVMLYEDGSDDAYYLEERGTDGTVTVTYYEKRISMSGDTYWGSVNIATVSDPERIADE